MAAVPIRLLAVDIDGTLLNPHFQISDADLAALRHARSLGIEDELKLVSNKKKQCVPNPAPGFGTVTDFENESASQSGKPVLSYACAALDGYTNGTPLLQNLNYPNGQPPSDYLYYDGHPGYDYAFNYLTGVYPATSDGAIITPPRTLLLYT